MNICVFGSANKGIDEYFQEKGYELGHKLADLGHDVIFGAGSYDGFCCKGSY